MYIYDDPWGLYWWNNLCIEMRNLGTMERALASVCALRVLCVSERVCSRAFSVTRAFGSWVPPNNNPNNFSFFSFLWKSPKNSGNKRNSTQRISPKKRIIQTKAWFVLNFITGAEYRREIISRNIYTPKQK